MTTPLTVVIPTHGRPDLLVRTLDSLAQCDLPRGYAGCVVAENGGKHGAEAACRAADARLKVRYLYHEQGNKSATINRVLEDLRDEPGGDGLIVFFDDDVRLSPAVLTAYAAAAQAHGPGHWFAGPTAVDYESEPLVWLLKYLPPSAKGWTWAGGEAIDRPDAMGFNWAAFAADLNTLGGFDRNVGPGSPSGATGQETDMMRRLLAAGFGGRYLPDARVWHWVPAERCSPRWTLRRTYKNTLQSQRSAQPPDVPWLLGYPRFVLPQLATAAVVAAASALLPVNSDRFEQRRRFEVLRGTAHGWRLARNGETAGVSRKGERR